MLGVIVCPRCSLVQGADLSMVRVTCPRCGGKIEIGRSKVYFSTDSPMELADGVRRVGERMIYRIDEPSPRPPHEPPRHPSPNDEQALRKMVHELTGGTGEATREELRRGLGGVDDTMLDAVVERLLLTGIIFEASPGRYRLV
jgi:hypothetical protein